MLRVGLTGGIGSGKTTVAKIFAGLGIPVYYADDAAKLIMNEDLQLKEAITAAFGAETYKDGRLDRKFLAGQVFGNPAKLTQLNALVHPATIMAGQKWMLLQTGPYAIKEAALIFESGGQDFDYVIGVTAPVAVRIHRTMKRDNITREQVMERMSRQIDDEIKMRLCDTVIHNDGVRSVIGQVVNIDRELRARE